MQKPAHDVMDIQRSKVWAEKIGKEERGRAESQARHLAELEIRLELRRQQRRELKAAMKERAARKVDSRQQEEQTSVLSGGASGLGSLVSAKALSALSHSSPALSVAGLSTISASPYDLVVERPSRRIFKVSHGMTLHPAEWEARLRFTSAAGRRRKIPDGMRCMAVWA
mmetsp:Transcript_119876/g.188028  ORF Transcript_119876/g.188028 Transcript_119876/m.188028 type:complete len:169 (+) Transcript_119876:62-568(+)